MDASEALSAPARNALFQIARLPDALAATRSLAERRRHERDQELAADAREHSVGSFGVADRHEEQGVRPLAVQSRRQRAMWQMRRIPRYRKADDEQVRSDGLGELPQLVGRLADEHTSDRGDVGG